MGIKKLKSENKFLSLTIGDMLAKVDPSKTKKYTQFLVLRLEEHLSRYLKNYNTEMELQGTSKFDEQVKCEKIEDVLTRVFLTDFFAGKSRLNSFISFCELMDRGLVNEKDISKYDSWDMLEHEYFEATNRDLFKKSKKEILKIYEDETYLVLKPLSYMASVAYGYQAKWCTAMVNNNEYFYNYSRGILIYVLNKKDNNKVAFYTRVPERHQIKDSNDNVMFEVWDAEDRRIDSFQSGVPFEILKIISMEMDTNIETNVANCRHFSDKEKENMRNAGYEAEPEMMETKISFGVEEELPNIVVEQPMMRYAVEEPIGFRPRRLRPEPAPIIQMLRSVMGGGDLTLENENNEAIDELP